MRKSNKKSNSYDKFWSYQLIKEKIMQHAYLEEMPLFWIGEEKHAQSKTEELNGKDMN